MNIELTALVSIASLALAYLGYHKGVIDTTKDKGKSNGRIEADIQYIKRLTEDSVIEQRATRELIDDLMIRVTRTEESVKSAHKRLDKVEGTE